MTRNLRKRHLIIWVAIAITISILLTMARLNTPVFKGETTSIEASR